MSVVGVVFAGLVGVASASSAAHPLGNFTTNTYAGLTVGTDSVAIDYVVDLAEIPTQQTMPTVGPEYGEERCRELADGLELRVDDDPVAVASHGAVLSFPPGLGGLPTLRLECDLVAPTASFDAGSTLSFRDTNLEGTVGWREVTAAGDGMTLVGSDVPEASVSSRLTSYPEGRRAVAITEASFTVEPGGAAATAVEPPSEAAAKGAADRQSRWLAGLVDDRRLTVGAGLVAFAVSVLLGSLHALAPGHGKTIMAAYIVGRRGGLRHVLGIGATVALTHTIGVLALGLVLAASETFAGATVYPVLSAASGVLVIGVGVTLLRRLRRDPHHHHPHDHDHSDGHHHDHGHNHDHQPVGWGGLVAMGVAGGMVPSPSAVLVLLAALALGRAWFGVVLVTGYGVGMAITLLGAGLTLNRLRDWIEPRLASISSRRLPKLLPLGSALAVIGGGLLLTLRAVVAV
jgi:nickel/cobalt exporter